MWCKRQSIINQHAETFNAAFWDYYGGDYYCAATTRNSTVDGLTFSVQSNTRDSGGTQNNCMYEKKRVLKQRCLGVYSGVKTMRVGKTDVDENVYVETVIKKLPDSLTPDQREKVIDLIKRNSNLFSKHDFECRMY